MSAKDEKQIERIMNGLQCSREEAIAIHEQDLAIDRGENPDFNINPEAEKWAKKLCNATTRKRPTVYNFNKRERKPNATKGGLIAELVKFLTEASDFDTANVVATNAERQIAFSIGEDNFELTLVQKRKPKN